MFTILSVNFYSLLLTVGHYYIQTQKKEVWFRALVHILSTELTLSRMQRQKVHHKKTQVQPSFRAICPKALRIFD